MNADTYSIEMQIIPSERDTFFIPVGRGIERSRFVKPNKSIETTSEESLLEMASLLTFKDGYNNQYLSLELEPNEQISFLRDAVCFPPSPDLNPDQCLKNDDRFCKWQDGGYIENLVTKNKNLTEKEKVLFFGRLIKNIIAYSFPRVKCEYADEILEKKLPQDCLGMHGVLCAMLRCSGIPSIVDVGLRLDSEAEDQPHVWLWYFSYENNKWEIVDLNDSLLEVLIGDKVKSPRMSVSLGTTHNINDHTVSFVQYLVSEKMLRGELTKPHNIKTKIFFKEYN